MTQTTKLLESLDLSSKALKLAWITRSYKFSIVRYSKIVYLNKIVVVRGSSLGIQDHECPSNVFIFPIYRKLQRLYIKISLTLFCDIFRKQLLKNQRLQIFKDVFICAFKVFITLLLVLGFMNILIKYEVKTTNLVLQISNYKIGLGNTEYISSALFYTSTLTKSFFSTYLTVL